MYSGLDGDGTSVFSETQLQCSPFLTLSLRSRSIGMDRVTSELWDNFTKELKHCDHFMVIFLLFLCQTSWKNPYYKYNKVCYKGTAWYINDVGC